MEPLEARAHYEAWLAAGRHGDMAWLASPRNRQRRSDPHRILPGIASVVCVALCHQPQQDQAMHRRTGRIARYALGTDYHAIMGEKLGALVAETRALLPGARVLEYSDTGAILERGWAERAGLGWIGKHSGLLSQTLGSWLVLGELLIDRALEPDVPLALEHCGTCHRCIDACPTAAIVAPYQLDARRCISYLTIEHRGAIPIALRPAIGDWVFGCDLCQEACPWNRFAPPARDVRLHARRLEGWSLERFLSLDEAGFQALFAGSPIRRARRAGFLRNVCVALGNRGDAAAIPALATTLTRDAEPLVRAHAAWALGELGRAAGAGTEARAAAGAALRGAASEASSEVHGEVAMAIARLGEPAPATVRS